VKLSTKVGSQAGGYPKIWGAMANQCPPSEPPLNLPPLALSENVIPYSIYIMVSSDEYESNPFTPKAIFGLVTKSKC